MLELEPGDSLKHIQTRKILAGLEGDHLGMQKEGCLGSDGETSDYQRSTPSPQDSEQRITELGEGLEKAPAAASSLDWKATNSPDLGFVDYVDYISASKQDPAPGPGMPPFSDCHAHPGPAPNTANILLNKSLKVDLEKLPTVMTSMVTSKNHPSLMFKRSEAGPCNKTNSRKRYATATTLGTNQRSGSKKCPRYVASDQRKTSLNKTIPGSKELLLHPNLFNSFRITKPKSNIKCDSTASTAATKCNESKSNGVNGIHFETQSFYKFSDSSKKKLAVSKQSDLAPAASVPPPTAFTSTKTDSARELSPLGDGEDCDSNHSLPPAEPHPAADSAVFALPNPKKIRFPAVPNSSAIQCKWEGCGECFKTHGNLSDHIKTAHVVGVESSSGTKYACMWVGCKVYGKQSSSLKWLESHVPRHGGKFAYPCIVEGCRMRFSSQAMLERHVNSHFTESSNSSSQTGPRKSIEGATAKKRLKRAGVRLKFRQLPFSARIFDFFDAGIMSGVRHGVSSVLEGSARLGVRNDEIHFHSKIISMRKEGDGRRQVQLKWIPEDLLPDTWVPVDEVPATKTVKICNLPESSKQKLRHELMGQPAQRTKQSRKTKRREDFNPFLTPAEAEMRLCLQGTPSSSSSSSSCSSMSP